VTRPTARVLTLLEILQSGGVHTVSRLAGRLGVDERTVRRYAGHLVDLEIPVESVRGRYGGYRLSPGFRMPPLMLTGDEALAVVLGLIAGRHGLAPTSREAAESAAAKVRRVLPKALGGRLEALAGAVEFTTSAVDRPAADTEVLLRVAEAVRESRPLEIGYTDRAGRVSERVLHPYGIVAHAGRWYVAGLDVGAGVDGAGAMRTLRLDRIGVMREVPGGFAVPEGFRPAEAVLSSLGATPWRHEVVVLVRGSVDDVRRRLRLDLATVSSAGSPGGSPDGSSDGAGGSSDGVGGSSDDPGGGWSRVRFRAQRLDWVPGVLAGLGSPFVIEGPAELRDVVREWAARIAGYATATTPEQAATRTD
jgi:predicted DNA-binding transcriptional regulator YafY